MNIEETRLEFLWYSYFGISMEKSEEIFSKTPSELIEICAKRAYRDLNRTLRFTKVYKDKNDDDKDFCNKVCKFITDNITKLFNTGSFDNVHKELCSTLKINANDTGYFEKDFTYGHAQKWLNMTLKYMLLMGFWKEQFEKIKNELHVPVDRYIIKEYKEKIPKEQQSKYNESWSTWDDYDNVYMQFQKDLRYSIKGKTPIEWEGPAWIEIADELKGKNK